MVSQAMAGSQSYREKDIRFGITVGYDPDYDGGGIEDPASYPTAPANTFWVKLGQPEFVAEAGEQELNFSPYDPPEYRLAHHPLNEFVAEGEVVRLALVHGQYYILPEGEGGGGVIEFKILSVTTKVSGPFIGLKAASAIVHGSTCSPNLIGSTVEVIDHSNELFDEGDMVGYTGWASEMIFWSLDPADPCETPSPCHWTAINRVCSPNTGTYDEPCPPEES
jgi:hypothetical protein